MQVKVKFFAMCREITQTDEASLELPDQADLEDFWKRLSEKFPELIKFKAQSRLAVNMEYAPAGCILENGDEVCIIPPVSGG